MEEKRMKTLREMKEELKKEWEDCFDKKIEDKLNDEGLKKFWDDNTTIGEAEVMLTCAALDDFIDDLFGNLLDGLKGAVIFTSSGCKDNKKEVKKPFEVERIKDNYFYSESFETIKEANEYINNICLNSEFKVDDFRIVKVM